MISGLGAVDVLVCVLQGTGKGRKRSPARSLDSGVGKGAGYGTVSLTRSGIATVASYFCVSASVFSESLLYELTRVPPVGFSVSQVGNKTVREPHARHWWSRP